MTMALILEQKLVSDGEIVARIQRRKKEVENGT